MSKAPWQKCRYSGLNQGKLKKLSDRMVREVDGEPGRLELDIDVYPDCDLFYIKSIAEAAGYKDYAYFEQLLRKFVPGSCHMHKYRAENNGAILGYATATLSAQAVRKLRQASQDRSNQNLKRGTQGFPKVFKLR